MSAFKPTRSADFQAGAFIALQDVRLQGALEGATQKFRFGRAHALAELPQADALRDHFKSIRAATLSRLADHLETFERQATQAGAQVHWARDAAEARAIVLAIARAHNVTLATKGKSMVSEEIELNAALAAGGIEAVETDLGEWIVQLAEEPPAHIIGPAIHKTRQQVAELISQAAGRQLPPDDIQTLAAEARRLLRQKFLAAGMGISGANLLVAETGSVVVVENEGNIRLVASAPQVHIAIVGLEKVARTWDDAAVWLALLARSATGQPLSVYTSVITGPARAGDPDGPAALHIILLDNGRSRLTGGAYEEVLQCIRCGACLNICPVYRHVGGHTYGSPYSGPIGAVITPLLFGLERYSGLPQASTLCGACLDVCPVRIDLPRLLLTLRAEIVTHRLLPASEQRAEKLAAALLLRPGAWRLTTGLGRRLQRPWLRDGRLRLPRRLDPAPLRRLPPLAPRSFQAMWEEGLSAESEP